MTENVKEMLKVVEIIKLCGTVQAAIDCTSPCSIVIQEQRDVMYQSFCYIKSVARITTVQSSVYNPIPQFKIVILNPGEGSPD